MGQFATLAETPVARRRTTSIVALMLAQHGAGRRRSRDAAGGPFYDTMESGIVTCMAQSPWALTAPTIDLSATPGPDAFAFSVRYELEDSADDL